MIVIFPFAKLFPLHSILSLYVFFAPPFALSPLDPRIFVLMTLFVFFVSHSF